jgi:hypothetical protein
MIIAKKSVRAKRSLVVTDVSSSAGVSDCCMRVVNAIGVVNYIAGVGDWYGVIVSICLLQS